MLSRIDLRGQTPTTSELRRALPRGGTDVDSVIPTVAPVVEDIRQRGAAAALEYGQKFDGVVPESVRVPQEVMDQALSSLEPAILAALEESIRGFALFTPAKSRKTTPWRSRRAG